MRIAIPIERAGQANKVCASFGRAPYFLLLDVEKNIRERIVNDAANSPGGAGIRAAQIIVNHHVDALMTPRCGENAAQVLKEANVLLFKTKSDDIDSNINDFKENKSELLNTIHSGFHSRGQAK